MKTNLVNPDFRSDYLRNLMKYRGIYDLEGYLKPSVDFLSKPTDLDNLKEGADLLEEVIMKQLPIMLVVDCDVDGFTSSAVIYQYIKLVDPSIQIDYIIHTHKQHGLEDCIDKIINSEVKYGLVICPDSSSNDFEYHEKLKEVNIPVLVLDHHELDQKVSSNCVLINNQTSSRYYNKDLTGVGVTWQFCRYLDEVWKLEYADQFIDLVALGVDADMGSVLSLENRYIMITGFNNIHNKFFKAAIEKQSFSMKGEVNPMSVAFYIVPMMNAMIRMGTIEEKERLFIGLIDPDRMVESHKRGAKGTLERVCVESLRECTNAKAHQTKAIDNMVDKLEGKIFEHGLLDNKILFIRLDDDDVFPSEINGLIAMKLSKRYKKPTIVARLNDEGMIKGSIRGLDDCELRDFKQFLMESGLFEYVQGHPNAAGCSIAKKNMDKFHEYANTALKDVDFGENVYDINFGRIAADEDLIELITELSRYPDLWGQKNPTPLLGITDIVFDTDADVSIMGKNQDTVKIMSHGISYIKFFAKDFIENLQNMAGRTVRMNVVGKANLNEWMGTETPQIFIENYELLEDNGF